MPYQLKLLIYLKVILIGLAIDSFAETNEPTWRINTAKNIDIHQFITRYFQGETIRSFRNRKN